MKMMKNSLSNDSDDSFRDADDGMEIRHDLENNIVEDEQETEDSQVTEIRKSNRISDRKIEGLYLSNDK